MKDNATNKKTKYGLLSYDTINIGDEIQSLAAQRFLPKIDYYFNRNNIDETKTASKEDIRIIMNGWYTEPAINNKLINWPPLNSNLNPLLISMHISFLNGSHEIFKKPESIKFLKKHGPVGARDLATYDYLKTIGVPAYFSGCLTLTLLPDPNIKKQNFILAVDVSDKIYKNILLRTKRPVIKMNTSHAGYYSTEARFTLAKYWLTLYQSAHCVITTRLHAMLPSLAFNTPTIGIAARDAERFTGLIDLTNHYTEEEFLNAKNLDLDKPPKNPTTFHSIRNNLVKTCSHFTSYDSKSSYLYGATPSELYNNPTIINIFTSAIQDSYILNNITTDQLANLQSEIEALKSPGIKKSTKTLLSSIKKHFSN